MRRQLLPAILVLVALAAGAAALQAGPGAGSVEAATAVVAHPDAPVLSARRAPVLLATPLGERRLAAALDEIWMRGGGDGCLVVVDGDRPVYEREPDRSLIPASNMKLLTAMAVLEHLDPDERLRTVVAGLPVGPGGVVDGDLHVVGGGDPLLGTRAWAEHFTRQPALHTPLEVLADRIRDAGIREVRGRLIGDDGRYDRVRHVPTWRARYVTDHETGPLSALSVNDGFESWRPSVPFADPAAGGAGVLNELLRQRGVDVRGGPGSGPTPPGLVEHAAIESAAIAELVAQMVRESDNGTAELLVKELGVRVAGDGSTAAGTAVIASTVTAAGLPADGLHVADGSGLDRGNRLTCRLLVALLSRAAPGGPIDAGLPVAATSGTLWRRFVDTPLAGRVRAKTGSINQVASLAGFVATDGGQLLFAHVVNAPLPGDQARALQDDLVRRLARHPDLPGVDALRPAAHPGRVSGSPAGGP